MGLVTPDERHDCQVAVKVLKPELAAVVGAERFVVEIASSWRSAVGDQIGPEAITATAAVQMPT